MPGGALDGYVKCVHRDIQVLRVSPCSATHPITPHANHAPTISATTVAKAAPAMPIPPTETSPTSKTRLMNPAPSVTSSGVTESMAPRRADCATMESSTAGAPMARMVVYCSFWFWWGFGVVGIFQTFNTHDVHTIT